MYNAGDRSGADEKKNPVTPITIRENLFSLRPLLPNFISNQPPSDSSNGTSGVFLPPLPGKQSRVITDPEPSSSALITRKLSPANYRELLTPPRRWKVGETSREARYAVRSVSMHVSIRGRILMSGQATRRRVTFCRHDQKANRYPRVFDEGSRVVSSLQAWKGANSPEGRERERERGEK